MRMRLRSRSHATAFALLLTLPALLAAPSAGAQSRQPQPANNTNAADDLMHRGVELREQGHDDQALIAFAQAWQLSHRAESRAQMALAEQALGRWADAEAHLNEALAITDPWITRNRRALQGALTEVRRHLGSLDVLANVPGAEVRVGGQLVGTVPLAQPIRLPIGSVTIVVSAPGMRAVTRTVNIDGTALARETVALERDDGSTPQTQPGPQPVPQPGPQPVAVACPAGQVVTPETAGHCCWVGQVWANVRQLCVGVPAACPAGMAPQGDACVLVTQPQPQPQPYAQPGPYTQPGPYAQPGPYGQPVYLPGAPPVMMLDDSQEILISSSEANVAYNASVRIGSDTYRCNDLVSVGRPCRLRDVPMGDGRITFGARHAISRSIHVPHGHSTVTLRRRGYGASIGGYVLGAASSLFVALAVSAGHDQGLAVGAWVGASVFGLPAAILMLEDLLRSRYEVNVVDILDDRSGIRRGDRGLQFRGIAAAPVPTGGAVVLGTFTF